MNTVKIVKSDADVYQAGRTYVDITECYAIKDTIPVTSNWTAEEVAVLATLDLDEIGEQLIASANYEFTSLFPFTQIEYTHNPDAKLSKFLRSHIQAEIKRQEASE